MQGRKRLQNLMVSLAVLVACLGVAECGLRQFAPIWMVGLQSAFEYDPDLGYRLIPGVHRYKLTDHLEEVRTSKAGPVGFQDDFSRYPTLIFALGDSYTQGTGTAADASYPFQLDLLLNRDENGFYQERYGVVNLGLAALGTEQSLVALRRFAAQLGKTRYVLYFGCDNRWDDDVLFRSGYRHRHLVYGSPSWGRFVGPLLWLTEFEVVKRAKLFVAEMRRDRMVAAATPQTARAAPVAQQGGPGGAGMHAHASA